MRKNHILVSLAASVLLSASIAATAQDKTLPSVYNPGVMLSAMSDNAVYALSRTAGDENVDNPRGAGGTLYNLETKKGIKINAPGGWAEVSDVADNGIVVGSASGKPGYWSPETETWTTFPVPAIWGGGTFLSVTPDAHYAVGYYFDSNNDFIVAPMLFDLTKGVAIETPSLPTKDLSGVDQHQNVFFGISPDGRYALGQMSQSYLLPVSMFSYIYDIQEHTWDPIGYDYNPQTSKFTPQHPELHFIDNQYYSCDGTWVTGAAYIVRANATTADDEAYYPYRYNVADKTFELFDNPTNANIIGNRVTSDGVLLASSPAYNPYPTAMVYNGKHFISLDQIIQQVYGMTVRDLVKDEVTGTFMSLSADGLTALMSSYDHSYVITMPEPFYDLSQRVDLLANYSVNIPNGSQISRVSEIKLTFDRQIDVLNYPQDIKLVDDQGKVVRNASGFTISPTNGHEVVLTFRSTSLTPGVAYTIEIPAGMIWLKDDTSIKSKAIKLQYKGREEGAIKTISISPLNGMAVAQFNTTPDYLAVTFNVPVAISSTGHCTLYNADDDSMIASFVASVSGNTAYFYPTATYNLYKGSNYRVVIGAGTVTDLSGAGGNEEIVLNYKGSYVRQLSDDDIYIFNAPCDSYDNFIFWEGETNQPASIPAGWGFEPDNSWLLLRDNDSSTDWALAAHSMFSPAGESDDWLITPQLYIPDGNTYLTFDAQSYMHAKDDVLKVYIYRDDAVYNYFSNDLADEFRKNGDLVLDEIIPAGKTDEGLDGEWSHYTIALDKYAGSNIYIAFVNNNYDKSAIFLDDIKVMRNLNFIITNQTPTSVVDTSEVTVNGLISAGSDVATFKGVNLKLIDADGNVISTITDKDASIVSEDVYKFSFPNSLPLTPGEEVGYKIEVASGNETMTFAYSVKDLFFSPVKRVVLEEYTGAACGNCPLGIQAIENLQRLFPDNFIAITLRTYQNDLYSAGITDYNAFLGMNGAPTGRINRGEILSPMVQNGSKGYEFSGAGITLSDGSEPYLWADAVRDQLAIPADAEVDFEVIYDAATSQITIPANVKFALNKKNANIGVFAVVLEDYLPTYQLNYFNSISDPKLGQWGAGGMYSQNTVTSWLASDVARYVVNGSAFNGTPLTESDFYAGTEYSITLSGTIPQGRIVKPENCKVAVMIIDRSNGTIINAATAKFGTSGITGVATDSAADVIYYDLNGRQVKHPTPGDIYVKVQGNNATKIRYQH